MSQRVRSGAAGTTCLYREVAQAAVLQNWCCGGAEVQLGTARHGIYAPQGAWRARASSVGSSARPYG